MTESTKGQQRNPYVGEGEDGARRSARIDREEADGLDYFDPRYDERLTSAQAWEAQAHELMLDRLGPRPTLEQVRARVGSEEWLAGLALLALSPTLAGDAAGWTQWAANDGQYTYSGTGEERVGTFHPTPLMQWDEWVADVDERGRGWSSSEWRLSDLVAGITVAKRRVSLTEVFTLGSWEGDALAIVVEWASGGNQRDQPGRYTVAPRLRAL